MKKGLGVIVASGACALALLAVPAAAENGGHGQAMKAAVQACKTERSELGREAFADKYGKHPMKTCIGETIGEARNAAQECRAERDELGVDAFREKYGKNENDRNAFGKCVSEKVADKGADDPVDPPVV